MRAIIDPMSSNTPHKRQLIRRAVGLISLAAFPITMYYLSPFVPLAGLAAGVVSGAWIVFGVLLLSALFLGRVFCGWLCPVGALQDLLRSPDDAPRFRTTRLAIVRFVVFTLWIAAAVVVLAFAGLPRRVDLTFMTVRGISVVDAVGLVVLASVLALFGILTAVLGRRGGCRSICWVAPFVQAGAGLGRTLRLPQLSLVSNSAGRCTGCDVCAHRCPMALAPRTIAVSSTGATPSYSRSECVLCARCADRCPTAALRLGWVRRPRRDQARLNSSKAR